MELKSFIFCIMYVMKNHFLNLFLSTLVFFASVIDSIPKNCAMECCKQVEDSYCQSEKDNSHNCEYDYGSCFDQNILSENILETGHKNDFKEDSYLNTLNLIVTYSEQNESVINPNFNLLKKNTTTTTPLIC